MKKLYEEEDIRAIAEAIRNKNKTDETYKVSKMPDAILNLSSIYHHEGDRPIIDSRSKEPWVRPEGWPDLDSLPMPNDGTNCIYLTIDNSRDQAYGNYIRFVHNGSCDCFVDYGHVENGMYVIDSTDAGKNAWTSPVHLFTPDDVDYPVVRLRSERAIQFKQQGIPAVTAADSPNGIAFGSTNGDMTSVIEVVGSIPTITSIAGASSTPVYGGRFCQRILLKHCDKITSMSYAFSNNVLCRSLVLETDNGSAKLIGSLISAFANCINLYKLDLTMIDVSGVTSLANTFDGCRLLDTLDISNWNITNACTSLSCTFRYCYMLNFDTIHPESWDVSNVTTVADVFSSCYKLETLDISNWNLEKVTTLYDLVYNDIGLRTLKMPHHQAPKLTNIAGLCNSCYNLEGEVDLSYLNPESLDTSYNAFSACYHLERVKLGNMKIVTNTTSTSASSGAAGMFNTCYSLKQIDWDMSKCDFSESGSVGAFYGACYNLETPIDWSFFSGMKYATTFAPWQNCYKVPSITLGETVDLPKVNTLANLYYGCHSLKRIDMSMFKLSTPITSMASMFANCRNVEEIIMPVIDTSAVTTITSMFAYCYALKELPNAMRQLNLTKCVTMSSVFSACRSLLELDLRGWINMKPTTVTGLFGDCTNLRSIDCDGWNTSALTGSHTSFLSTHVTTTLNQSGWKATITGIIPDCNALVEWYPPEITVSCKVSGLYSLSDASLERLAQTLPKVTAATTITMGAPLIKRLSAAQIATITGKGWTIA